MAALSNRSIPDASVMPVLGYPDVSEAADWLCRAFGFTPRLRIGTHRVQLVYGSGALVVTEGTVGEGASVMVRVADADAHCEQARAAGALIVREPETQVYGERQYTAADPQGRLWTFTQSVADVDPASWGGELV